MEGTVELKIKGGGDVGIWGKGWRGGGTGGGEGERGKERVEYDLG